MAQSKYIKAVQKSARGRPKSKQWYREKIREFGTPKAMDLIRDGKQATRPFFGIKPVDDHVASTSLLIQESDVSKVFNSNWQKLPKFASYTPTNSWDKTN